MKKRIEAKDIIEGEYENNKQTIIKSPQEKSIEIYKDIKVTYSIKPNLTPEYLKNAYKGLSGLKIPLAQHIYNQVAKRYGQDILDTMVANGERLEIDIDIWHVELEATKKGIERGVET